MKKKKDYAQSIYENKKYVYKVSQKATEKENSSEIFFLNGIPCMLANN